MFNFKIEINVKALTTNEANNKAKAVETLAKNLDEEALLILADKSNKPGMSNKVRKFKSLM